DRNVTGVQTCALPISQRRSPHGQAQKSSESIGGKSRRPGMPADVLHRASICFSWTPIRGLIGSMLHEDSLSSKLVTRGAAHAWRSEERRVGKEGGRRM